jgi:hypothetical protein
MTDHNTYTEAEVRAREASAAEAMREACATWHEGKANDIQNTLNTAPTWWSTLTVAGFISARDQHNTFARDIRAIPLPHADALAAIRAEARREGMAKTALWHDEQAAYCSKRAQERLAEGHRSAFGALKTVQATHENSAEVIRAAALEGKS